MKKEKKQTTEKKRTWYDYLDGHEEAYKNNKMKSLIDFDGEYSSSIKTLAVKKIQK